MEMVGPSLLSSSQKIMVRMTTSSGNKLNICHKSNNKLHVRGLRDRLYGANSHKADWLWRMLQSTNLSGRVHLFYPNED
jgi:hypothetical protein